MSRTPPADGKVRVTIGRTHHAGLKRALTKGCSGANQWTAGFGCSSVWPDNAVIDFGPRRSASHAALLLYRVLRGRAAVGGRKVGSTGYCRGGRLAYLAAAIAGVDAAVAKYGGAIHTHIRRAVRPAR